MLVLSRKCGERIMVGDVVIEVVRINRDKIRLGISAPVGTPIYREEVHQRKGGGPLNLPRNGKELERGNVSAGNAAQAEVANGTL